MNLRQSQNKLRFHSATYNKAWFYCHKFIFFLFLQAFLYTSSCQADPEQVRLKIELTTQEQAWVKTHPQIRVGGSPDWAPFNFVNKNSQYSGIANDYLQLISQKTGLNFTLSIAPWSDNLKKIRNNKIDILPAVYFTKERSQYLAYSSPYFEVLDYFFIRDDLDVKTLTDLNGKRVAIPESYAHIELIKKHFPKIKIVVVNTFGDAIDAVLENRADLLYDTYGALIYTLEKEGINTILPFKSTRQLGKNPIHIVTRKDNSTLSAIIQKGMNAITVKEQREIYNKWLGNIAKSHLRLKLTAQERKWITAHPVVRYGAEKDWAPYDFINKHGSHDGLTREYLNLISQSSGIKFEAVISDWDNLLQLIKQKEIDLLPAIYYSAARDKYLSFTLSYLSILDYFFIRDDTQAQTMDDLKGKTVAIPKGYVHINTIRQQYPELKLLQTDNLMAAIQSVIEKKADILLESYAVINHQLKQNGIYNIHPFKALKNEAQMKLHMAVQQDQKILLSILNKALASFPEAEKRHIQDRWLGGHPHEVESTTIKLSKSEQQWLANHPVIRFTGDPDWLPYEAFNKQGKYIGIVAEYLQLIEQKLGIKININPTQTWTEAVAKVKRGEIDVLSETRDSDLKSHLYFTQSYIASPLVIVMKTNEYYVDNINQIKQRRIGLIKEYGYTPKIINKYPDINFFSIETVQEGLTDVSTGKIDALIATLAHASYHIAELGINNVRIVGKTEFTTQLAFGVRKDYQPLLALFNRALNDISQSDKQRILSNWGKQKYAAKIDYILLSKIAGLVLLVFSMVIYWNRKLASEITFRKELEAQTQALIDNIPLQILVTTFDGYILTANRQALNDYEIHKDDITDINVSDYYHNPKEREAVIKELTKYGKVEQKIIQFKQSNGSLRSMMVSIMPINYRKQSALLTIAVDLTERIEMEAAIKIAKESAEAANHAKSEFLANMSHEIRTPMNAIIGFTELLNEQIEDPKLKSFTKTIRSAGLNLLTLINDILDLSKIEAGKLQIEKSACNPHDLFSELREIFTIKMREKNIDFIVDIDPIIPQSLHLDATRLRQVLFNLVGNAVKFTEQGFIRLKVRPLNKNKIRSKLDLLIEIEDTGIGISEDQQQRVFQNFEQSKGQSIKKYGGTGLGLSISKRLVKLMGGKILLRSQVGHGSTFTIKLIDVHIASLNATEPDIKNLELSTLTHFLPGSILIVDDVENNRDLLLAIFSETNLQVMVAKNGQEAVDACKKQSFDLLLMDIQMPIMNGYQAAAEIKLFSDVPIIALTASVMKDEFDQVKSEHFAGYLRKPMLKADLVRKLTQFLPFEEITATEETLQTINLTAIDQEHLPFALDKLRKLTEQHQLISKNNNISEIKNFTNSLLESTRTYPVSLIEDYAEQLKAAVDSFDIATIKQCLNNYPQLISQLESQDKLVRHANTTTLK